MNDQARFGPSSTARAEHRPLNHARGTDWRHADGYDGHSASDRRHHRQIDQLGCELYGLTNDEIGSVEEATPR